jgi:hypothetical protein
MKAFRIVSLLALFTVLLTYSGCGDKGGTPEPIANQQFTKLSKTWKINTVTCSTCTTTDRTAEYTASSFQLILTGTKGSPPFSYSTSGRPALSPWKSSGAWEFGADPVTQVIRDKGTADELNMTYAVTETTLQVTFTFSGTGYSARTSEVAGQWIFTFKL